MHAYFHSVRQRDAHLRALIYSALYYGTLDSDGAVCMDTPHQVTLHIEYKVLRDRYRVHGKPARSILLRGGKSYLTKQSA